MKMVSYPNLQCILLYCVNYHVIPQNVDVQGSFKPGLVVLFIIESLLYSAVINIVLYIILYYLEILWLFITTR